MSGIDANVIANHATTVAILARNMPYPSDSSTLHDKYIHLEGSYSVVPEK